VVATAFTAGLATSVGPCVAPRYLALAALAAGTTGRARWLRIGCFVCGLLVCYALLAATASFIAQVIARSHVVYLMLAVGFFGFGIHALVVRRACLHASPIRPSNAGALLGGSALGLVLSPCCSPVIAILASVGASSGSFAASLTGALAFAAGHVAPIVTIGCGFGLVERLAPIRALRNAGGTVSGGLALALAAYYGLLA